MSPRSIVLALLAAIVVIAGVSLALDLGARDQATGSSSANASAGEDPGAAPDGVRARSRAALTASSGTGAEVEEYRPPKLTPEERARMDMEWKLKGEVPRRIRTAAAGCFDGIPFNYKELENHEDDIEIDFTVVLEGGVMTLRDVELTKGIGQPELETCVVEMVAELSWEDRDHADFSMPMGDAISLLSLKKYGEPMPHEMEGLR